jgi:hypothetical protein
MKLNEVFATIVPYEWTIDDTNRVEAEFDVADNHYAVMFERIGNPEQNIWSADFALYTISPNGEKIYTQSMTKTGHQFVVMSTVQAILLDWLKNHTVDCIAMTAAIPSRRVVYTKMLKHSLPTWNIELKNKGKSIYAWRPR